MGTILTTRTQQESIRIRRSVWSGQTLGSGLWSKNMASKNAIKLSGGLKELRLHLCQKSPASAGARQFVEKHYVPIKMSNPKFPIMVRECSGIQPRLWARYGYGREESL